MDRGGDGKTLTKVVSKVEAWNMVGGQRGERCW